MEKYLLLLAISAAIFWATYHFFFFSPSAGDLHRLGSALPPSHTPPLFSFVLGNSHYNIIFYSIPTHAMPNFLCWEETFLSLTGLSTVALVQAPYITTGGKNVHRP